MGIFSRDISKCLIKQLKVSGNTDEKLIDLIRYHMDDVINCVEQRRSTIIKVVGVILELQEGYFLRGSGLAPMSMEQVAARAGIHTSTVSRTIKGKYLQYKKVVLLKDLFTTSLTSQEDISADRMKKQIAAIIQAEDSTHPLSDQKISEIIREDGIVLSRRTVAKYRMELGIPDPRLRRYL